MKRISAFIISCTLIVTLMSNIFCGYMWSDGTIRDYQEGSIPGQTTYFDVNGNQVTKEEFMDGITRIALEGESPEVKAARAAGTLGNNASAPMTTAAPAPKAATTSNKTEKPQSALQINVYFTNLYGNVIGVSQITSGTNIADSQFPVEVPECDGKIFDRWDYDGHALSHDYIVRAIYK